MQRAKILGISIALLMLQAVMQPAVLAGDALLTEIQRASLPREARDTLRLIEQGGPFPFDRDGVVFSNFERVLPKQPRGYYHEYTVKTPGVRSRGARRIVCGIVSEGSAEKRSERDAVQGARNGATETYLEGRRGSEYRATQHRTRAASLSVPPECYYTADHYKNFARIRE